MHRLRACAALVLTVLCVCIAPTASRGASLARPSPKLAWVFDTHRDKDDTPISNVLLVVNGRRIVVARDLVDRFTVVERREFKDRDFPSKALIACAGWYAGGGDDYYVTRRGRRLYVYNRGVDESDKERQPFTLVKIIRRW